MERHYTYIKIFGFFSPPHLLPRYVLDRLLGREITYQIVEACITASLSVCNKIIWPNFPIKLETFSFLNVPHAKKEVVSLKELILCT